MAADADSAHVNKSYFNDEATNYDSKHRKLNERLTRELQARLAFIGVDWVSDDDEGDESDEDEDEDEKVKESRKRRKKGAERSDENRREVRLLDYACGTGMISRALAPYTTQCVGIDISENMVAAYNARAENQGLSSTEMHAMIGDLTVPDTSDHPAELSAPHMSNFDIAAVGGGFHHFADPQLAATRLVERLRPGGVLLIWDFLPHGGGHGHKHGAQHTVMHHGFSEGHIRSIFERAGAGQDFGLAVIGGGVIMGHGSLEEGDHAGQEALKRQVFFARGTKA
ncbi:Uu.00g109850.m01.CDS01 [Anthostomella pinea]|uniref:Uu.00g109850.m01.CDS01 n=1 Tax=Anthostomella pinea TaxID=933095 RepID=A0AAI8V9M9_9PEZI|nr:Uu.00g109850.m01.CDS01 [Anthostomella pinea]